MTATHTQIRDYLVHELRTELVGPSGPAEELKEGPANHYLAGVLYPPDTAVDSEEDRDAAEVPEDDEVVDGGATMATTRNPSALGLTFVVRPGTVLTVQPSAAIYLFLTLPDGQVWQRRQLDIDPLTLHVKDSQATSHRLATGLRLFVRVRPRRDRCVVTISLANDYPQPPEGERLDPFCFFQPELLVTAAHHGTPAFLPRGEEGLRYDRDERLLNDLLYRYAPEFAVGHGCAVAWDADTGASATALRTTLIPVYELPHFSPDPDIPFRAQEMGFLAEASPEKLVSELRELPRRYRDWIAALPVSEVPPELKTVAGQNLKQCHAVADRIEEGINLIASDPLVREAFQLANHAMLIQRARSDWLERPGDERPPRPDLDGPHRWRPFQIAFILLCLPSIADPAHPHRDVADLLWFPTGGGKTEAYLGLTAFTIFHRRLTHQGSHRSAGVTVLMRYTLRLLTLQQFQRAAILILACEHLRRSRSPSLGADPISLGLWVGGGATPNWLSEVEEALRDIEQGRPLSGAGSPFQVRSCPWCGTEITVRDYRRGASLNIGCPNRDCDFAGHLPLYLVDEDVYNRRPTLLIATVDKFARLPWLSQTTALFGGVDRAQLPPELIVQDELHLISGPLGTLVGLYETAIDLLCLHDGHLPKVVASTATIRRATEQARNLFNRGLVQFPPPALDARDSFFSRQVSADERPGRYYVGVHAPGRSMKTALLRIYAVLLQRLSEHTAADALRDPYWTLVGYFNSMRELGGAIRLVEDDIPDRMDYLTDSRGTRQRYINRMEELNSNVDQKKIPEVLELMTTRLGEGSPIDVLLATNMISVGMDVSRLSLMVVNGQPKTTSEYIQATSRVGRYFPGLVVTVYNWSRPRDRSHYERFVAYHSAIYSQVEPTSVTPFSTRARDRGLHGIFVALLRHLSPDLNPDDAAYRFDPNSEPVRYVVDRILERVAAVEKDEIERTRRDLERICHRWHLLADTGTLRYGTASRRDDEVNLLVAAEDPRPAGYMFRTLNSLREVEGSATIFYPRQPRRGGHS